MQVRLLTTLDELETLAPHWRRLAQGQPFLSPAWLAVWWRHFGSCGDRRLAVLVIADELGEIVAIAPWFVERSLLHGKTLRFLGCGAVCSEYLSIPCSLGWERPVAAAIADWLCSAGAAGEDGSVPSWDLLRLESTGIEDTVIDALCEALAQRGAIVDSLSSPGCWRLPLPETWEEYLALLSKSHRKRVRRLERAYFQSGRARLVIANTASQLDEAFDILVDMHAQRWAARGEPGVFDDVAMLDFHRAVTAKLFDSGQLSLSWLELDGRPVAAEYSLVGDGVIYAYQSGMAPDASQHEPGSLALMATLRGAIDRRIRVVDFLRGDEPYKRHWRAEPHPTRYVRVLPGGLAGRVRHRLWQAARGAKRWLRTGRDVVSASGTGSPALPVERDYASSESDLQEQSVASVAAQ